MATEKMPGLRRGFEIIKQCSMSKDGVSFSDLRKRCGNLPPTTLNRLLQVLLEESLVVKHGRTGLYCPGTEFIKIARFAVGSQDYTDLVKPIVDKLAVSTQESAVYFELRDDSMQLMCKKEMEDSYHYMAVGARWSPLVQDPFGLCCMPFMGEFKQQETLKEHLNNHLSDNALRDQILTVPTTRLVINRRSLSHKGRILRITSPVFAGTDGRVIGSLGITTMDRDYQQAELDHLSQAVRSAASEASARCGSVTQETT